MYKSLADLPVVRRFLFSEWMLACRLKLLSTAALVDGRFNIRVASLDSSVDPHRPVHQAVVDVCFIALQINALLNI